MLYILAWRRFATPAVPGERQVDGGQCSRKNLAEHETQGS